MEQKQEQHEQEQQEREGLEIVRLQGSTRVEAHVIDRYADAEHGITYGIALVAGERLPVMRVLPYGNWYLDLPIQ